MGLCLSHNFILLLQYQNINIISYEWLHCVFRNLLPSFKPLHKSFLKNFILEMVYLYWSQEHTELPQLTPLKDQNMQFNQIKMQCSCSSTLMRFYSKTGVWAWLGAKIHFMSRTLTNRYHPPVEYGDEMYPKWEQIC